MNFYTCIHVCPRSRRRAFQAPIRLPCALSIPPLPEITTSLNSLTVDRFCMKLFWKEWQVERFGQQSRGAGRDARSAPSLKGIPRRFQRSTEQRRRSHRRELAPPEGAGPHVGGAGARHNGRPRPPTLDLAASLPLFEWAPLPRDRKPGVALGATRRNMSRQGRRP